MITQRVRMVGLVLGLLLPHAKGAFAQQTARLNVDAVRVREAPDLTSPIVFSLQKGALVEVLKREGIWAQIRVEKRTGYIRLAALAFSSESTSVGKPPTLPAGPSPTSTPSTASPVLPPATPASSTSAPPAASSPATVQRDGDAPKKSTAGAGSTEVAAPSGGRSTAHVPSHLFALGLSVTPSASSSTSGIGNTHLAGHVMMQLNRGPIGMVGIGGMGMGDGYRSQVGNAGVSLALIRMGRVRFDVIGGGGYYAEQLSDQPHSKQAGAGAMAGASLQLPAPGPFRAAILGTYVVGKWQSAQPHDNALRFFRVVIGLGL